jgi:hypothetical protein
MVFMDSLLFGFRTLCEFVYGRRRRDLALGIYPRTGILWLAQAVPGPMVDQSPLMPGQSRLPTSGSDDETTATIYPVRRQSAKGI